MSGTVNTESREPLAVQTKAGGVVACVDFVLCIAKSDGAGCLDCEHNRYSQTKKFDNYVSAPQPAKVIVDHLTGTCLFGSVRLIIDSLGKDCHVFLDGKLIDDQVLGFAIHCAPQELTICELYLRKPLPAPAK